MTSLSFLVRKNRLCRIAFGAALTPALAYGANSAELTSEIQRFLKLYPASQVQVLRHKMMLRIAVRGMNPQRPDFVECVDARIQPSIFEVTSQTLAQRDFSNLSNLKEINEFLESSTGTKYRQQAVSVMATGLKQAKIGQKISAPSPAPYTPEEMGVIQKFGQNPAYADFSRFIADLLAQTSTNDTLDKKLGDIRLQCDLQTSNVAKEAQQEVRIKSADTTMSDVNDTPLKMGYAMVFRQTGLWDSKPYTAFSQFNVLYKIKDGGYAIERVRGEAGHVSIWDNKFAHKVSFTTNKTNCLLDIMGQTGFLSKEVCPSKLSIGDTWTEDENYPKPHTIYQYQVMGMEETQVPAGHFQTVKIRSTPLMEDNFESSKASEGLTLRNGPSGLDRTSKTRRSTYWFAPQLNIIIKGTIEFVGAPGTSNNTFTDELEAFGAY